MGFGGMLRKLLQPAPPNTVKAYWNDQLIAESENTIKVEGNYYFPPNAVDQQYLQSSTHTSLCRWKGEANYYHIKVRDQLNENAAWYYPSPKAAAEHIKGYIAFWNGVDIKH